MHQTRVPGHASPKRQTDGHSRGIKRYAAYMVLIRRASQDWLPFSKDRFFEIFNASQAELLAARLVRKIFDRRCQKNAPSRFINGHVGLDFPTPVVATSAHGLVQGRRFYGCKRLCSKGV
jgi:hypothetical protein